MHNCYNTECHITGNGINDVPQPKPPRKRKSKRRRKQYPKQKMADLPANIGDYEMIQMTDVLDPSQL